MNKSISFFRLIVFTILVSSIFACNNNKEQKETTVITDQLAKLIDSYTNGIVQPDENIQIVFNKEMVTTDDVGTKEYNDLFEFSEPIDGKTYWLNTRTIVFDPTNELEKWKEYYTEIDLSKIVEDSLIDNKLRFSFKIDGQEIVQFGGSVSLVKKDDPNYVLYKAEVKFNQPLKIETLKENVKLVGDQDVEVEVTSTDDNSTSFMVVSTPIRRTSKKEQYKITFSADELEMKEDFNKPFILSPVTEMTVSKIEKQEDGREPKLSFVFSDEFDFSQNIDGLVQVSPDVGLKAKRSGTRLILDGKFKFGTSYSVTVKKGVRSRWGSITEKDIVKEVKFADIAPQVEFVSDGIICPTSNDYKIQFYTTNLQRVHIELKKVYSEDLSEFIRSERLHSLKDRKSAFNNTYINRTGVIVHNESFEIDKEKNSWKLNEIDLSKIVELDKSAMYLVRLNFNKRDILIEDKQSDEFIEKNGQVYKPILFSDIGLTAKKIDGDYRVYVTDLKTGKPKGGVQVQLRKYYSYDDDRHIVDTEISDKNGMLTLNPDRYFYNGFIVASHKGQRSIIDFGEMSWNNSGFDIGGVNIKQETRVFAYTERGVYRPGSEINVSLIARHYEKDFPSNVPLTMDLYNPKGKKVYEQNSKINKDGFFTFKFETNESDPTGTWRAKWKLGDRWYSKQIKVETIVPFKLKLKMTPEKKVIDWQEDSLNAVLNVKYLFGTPAKNLDAEVEMELSHLNKRFPKYSKFRFSNPMAEYQRNTSKIYTGKIDEEGNAKIVKSLPVFNDVPSAVLMKLSTKVLEKGGRPNHNTQFVTIDPYSHYVGIQGADYNYFASGDDVELPVVLCDPKGNSVPGRSLKYRIYHNEKNWWWHYDRHGKLRFKSDYNTTLVKEGLVETKKEHSKIKFVPVELGTYFVEVIDENGSGHSTGYVFNAYRHGSVPSGKDAGTLNLVSDKKSYDVGDVAKVKFPIPNKGSVLLTVEQGDEILLEEWHKVAGEKFMEIEIPITAEMVPNAYAVVSLVQPHDQTVNDRPIRMYGILPFNVVDASTKKEIDIITEEFFRPKKDFEVKVQMKDHRKTQFTIAVVDEGLLDITAFKTPKPWEHFYQKTRLFLQTFDMFNHVINANKGDVFKTFAIGGDADYRKSQKKPDDGKKRFKPVSLYEGVLETDESGFAVVKFKMPNYIGSVRIMVVAAKGKAYGSAEKAVPVKSELMVQPSLPRVLGPSEEIKVPVSVFAMQPKLGKVTVSIETEGPISVEGNKTKTMNFAKIDEKDCFFTVKVKDAAGQAKVRIVAKSDKYMAEENTHIMVRPSSPRQYDSKSNKLTKGQTWETTVPKVGIDGSNNATLTISPFPNLNFGKRLRWLIRYPYGCLEQTTSALYPQLYLKNFIKYPAAFSEEIDHNINGGIQRLRNFQRFAGNLSYWPYSQQVNDWANLYAGHFMVSAKELGYHIPNDLYDNWLSYVSNQSRRSKGSVLRRSYRVYILALASKASLSEMNILRESHLDKMKNVEKWLLAAAYKLAGQDDIAKEIIKTASTSTEDYKAFNKSFGSILRDQALILEAAVVLEEYNVADKLARSISKSISANTYYSTHSLGTAISALGKYVTHLSGGKKVNIKGTVELASGKKIPFESSKATSINLVGNFGKNIKVYLDPSSTVDHVYNTLNYNGVPLHDPTVDYENNLKLRVSYFNEKGQNIDVSSLKQGTTFYAKFNVENVSSQYLTELALVQVLPSGWEVENMRLLGQNKPTWMEDWGLSGYDYQDIRDDRIMWFFRLCNPKPNYNRECYRKDFVVKLNAVTVGEFELPSTLCEAMYNDLYKATKKGKNVKVTGRK